MNVKLKLLVHGSANYPLSLKCIFRSCERPPYMAISDRPTGLEKIKSPYYATSRQGKRLIWYVNFTHRYKINQGVMVGGSPSLGWSPSNYKPFYCIRIWL